MKTHLSEESKEQEAAELVVRSYMEFLHSADTQSIMNLYDEDAVFLPANAPTAAGKAKIRESYIATFERINIPELAIVRLATKSTVLILSNKAKVLTNGRELFVLKKSAGSFKISRYMFNEI